MDEIRDGLKDAIRGRRGMICRVAESGRIRRGDRIEIVVGQPEATQHKGAIE
jgi:MOSC domain-containing protein YiiM